MKEKSTRCGEKVFQNVDVQKLNYIGKTEKATKVFNNLSSLKDGKDISRALNFFPDNLNTNIIWLQLVDNPSDVINKGKYDQISKKLEEMEKILADKSDSVKICSQFH